MQVREFCCRVHGETVTVLVTYWEVRIEAAGKRRRSARFSDLLENRQELRVARGRPTKKKGQPRTVGLESWWVGVNRLSAEKPQKRWIWPSGPLLVAPQSCPIWASLPAAAAVDRLPSAGQQPCIRLNSPELPGREIDAQVGMQMYKAGGGP